MSEKKKNIDSRNIETLSVHAGRQTCPVTGSIIPPIYQTATYVLDGIGESKGYDYTRSSNPTRAALEQNLAALENAPYAVSFASGMSAVDAVFRLLNTGDHIVSSDDVYGGVSRLLDQILSRFGIEVTYVDTCNSEAVMAAIKPSTKMLWIETPTNPLLKITDVTAMSTIAKKAGILLGIDSTFATPYLLRPLDLGADIVVHSATKYLSGHNAIIGGVCIVKEERLFKDLKFLQKSMGAVSSPFDCWLTLQGIKTLGLRMDRHCENAMKVARFLEAHPKIYRVAYPGLENDPGHEIAKSQMKDFGGMISFELVGGFDAGVQLLNGLKLICLAESLGAVETMITHPASMTHLDVPKEVREARGLTDGLVRLSVGIEHVDDILLDLKNSLDSL